MPGGAYPPLPDPPHADLESMIERRIEMIVFNIDVMMAKRKMTLTELSEKVGITMANLSILKTGKARAVRVDTLNRLCAALNCQPGDLLEWRED